MAQSYGPYIAHLVPLDVGQQFVMLISFFNTTCINGVWYEKNCIERGAHIVKFINPPTPTRGQVWSRKGCGSFVFNSSFSAINCGAKVYTFMSYSENALFLLKCPSPHRNIKDYIKTIDVMIYDVGVMFIENNNIGSVVENLLHFRSDFVLISGA